MNRKEYVANLNKINTTYQELKLKLAKRLDSAGIERLNKARRELVAELDLRQDDLMKLNKGLVITIK